jgi:hypothetical protein
LSFGDLCTPDFLKSAIYAGEQTGPLSGQQAGIVRGPDDAVGASEYNRENHLWHYWLNRSKSSQQRGNGGKGSSWARTMAKNGQFYARYRPMAATHSNRRCHR